jgi:hypothetical protein
MAESLAAQLLALAKHLGQVERAVEQLGERDEQLHQAVAELDPAPVREAIGHLEGQTAELQKGMASIAPLRDALTALTGQVAQLRQDLKALAEEPAEEKLALWNWAAMDQQAAADAWKTLIWWMRHIAADTYGWVGPPADALSAGYSGPGTPLPRIPPCWYRHPEAVWELSWLCQEWLKLYTTSYGSPSKAGDWWDRYAPGVRRRLTVLMEKCKNGHQPADPAIVPAPRAIDDDESLSHFISSDLSRRRPPPAQGPVEATG